MQLQTDAPVGGGLAGSGWMTVNMDGTLPRTTAAGSWLGWLSAPAVSWQVHQIQSTSPVAASRQYTNPKSAGFSPSPIPTYTLPLATTGDDQPAATGSSSAPKSLFTGWLCSGSP